MVGQGTPVGWDTERTPTTAPITSDDFSPCRPPPNPESTRPQSPRSLWPHDSALLDPITAALERIRAVTRYLPGTLASERALGRPRIPATLRQSARARRG